MSDQREMPKYKCHKEVHALKIKELLFDEMKGYSILPEDNGFAAFAIDADFVRKHPIEAGGYYVVYKDGYTSYSPAEAFESGYTRV